MQAKRNNRCRKAARAGGEATLPGARDDGTAATAEPHHQIACFPLRWEPGALSPAHARGDAGQAGHQGLPQPGLDGQAGCLLGLDPLQPPSRIMSPLSHFDGGRAHCRPRMSEEMLSRRDNRAYPNPASTAAGRRG